MREITCRTCGAGITVADGAQSAFCNACGAHNTVAACVAAKLLPRAQMLYRAREFTRAEEAYQRVLSEDPECYEALWGMALCRYGVEFVRDHATGRHIPLVHFPRRDPFVKNVDYRMACECAPADVRAAYEREAVRIDQRRREALGKDDEQPAYDVYLCHKTTAANGEGYSADYTRAWELYRFLTQKGLRVFFGPESLAQAGVDYEATMAAALKGSRAMLLICSDPANVGSEWVRNEWTRYLSMVDDQDDKRLIPLLYGDMRASQLPREIILRRLQALDMRAPDAEKALIRALR